MEIKKILENISNFLIKRFIEVFGLIISILSLLLLISLLSYSPEDPNFIFPNDTKINNTLGFKTKWNLEKGIKQLYDFFKKCNVTKRLFYLKNIYGQFI